MFGKWGLLTIRSLVNELLASSLFDTLNNFKYIILIYNYLFYNLKSTTNIFIKKYFRLLNILYYNLWFPLNQRVHYRKCMWTWILLILHYWYHCIKVKMVRNVKMVRIMHFIIRTNQYYINKHNYIWTMVNTLLTFNIFTVLIYFFAVACTITM